MRGSAGAHGTRATTRVPRPHLLKGDRRYEVTRAGGGAQLDALKVDKEFPICTERTRYWRTYVLLLLLL
jgi:hypothetical protein